MHNLIVFDIDGTLIHTTDLEDHCYQKAVHHALAQKFAIDTNWTQYQYSTDAGVFSEIVLKQFSRSPSLEETQTFQDIFPELLAAQLQQNGLLCQSLPGAQNLFDHILAIGWDIAIATGCIRKSADLKLNHAKIPTHHIPLATSNDDFDRKNIIQVAINRAKDFYQRQDYSHIFYVGDKLWDQKAAQDIGIGFIGIGQYWQKGNHLSLQHFKDYSCGQLLHYLKTQCR